MVYLWQVTTAWHMELQRTPPEGSQPGSGITAPVGGQQVAHFTGTGIATGATGNLRYYGLDVMGRLSVQDLPLLPTTKVYELWCLDARGNADACTTFRVPDDPIANGTPDVVIITSPQPMSAYAHFRITIEPAALNSHTPSSWVVMTN